MSANPLFYEEGEKPDTSSVTTKRLNGKDVRVEKVTKKSQEQTVRAGNQVSAARAEANMSATERAIRDAQRDEAATRRDETRAAAAEQTANLGAKDLHKSSYKTLPANRAQDFAKAAASFQISGTEAARAAQGNILKEGVLPSTSVERSMACQTPGCKSLVAPDRTSEVSSFLSKSLSEQKRIAKSGLVPRSTGDVVCPGCVAKGDPAGRASGSTAAPKTRNRARAEGSRRALREAKNAGA